MPRYLLEQTFPDGFEMPMTSEGVESCLRIVDCNAAVGVTWVQSYVSADRRRCYCICDGPDEVAIRRAADRNRWPVDSITRVSVLTPYFYR